MFDIVEGAERESTANLKRSLKVAINACRAYSTPCGIKSSFKTNMLGQPVLEGTAIKYSTIHLTPLAVSPSAVGLAGSGRRGKERREHGR